MGTTTRNALDKLVAGVSTRANLITYFNDNLDKIDAALAKCNFTGSIDPVDTDDEAAGYAAGSMWYNATDHKIFVCEDATEDGAVWRQIWPALAADLSITSQTRGDLIFRGASAWERLAKGTSGQFLKQGANDPAWASPAAADITFAATAKILGRKTASGGAGEECSLDELLDLIGTPAQGDILYRGASALARLAAGTKGQALSTQGAAANPIYLDRTPGLYHNAIINPQFQVNQRAVATYTSATTPANSDDTYLLDQWVLLSDGNDIVDVSQEFTIVPVGAPSCLKLEVETANKKFGKIFFLENKDALKFAGKSVSLQLKARTTTGKAIRNIRAAVLSWSGTADTLTSDVVDAWGADGSNPTLVANWTAENVAANLVLVADTWTTFKIENIAIDTASMTNLAVFIWCDDADAAVDDLLYIGDVQLNEGPICLPFMPKTFSNDIKDCRRFFQKSYEYGTAIGTATHVGSVCLYPSTATETQYISGAVMYREPIHHSALPTIYSCNGVAAKFTRLKDAIDVANATCAILDGYYGKESLLAANAGSTQLTAGSGYEFHYVISAEL